MQSLHFFNLLVKAISHFRAERGQQGSNLLSLGTGFELSQNLGFKLAHLGDLSGTIV